MVSLQNSDSCKIMRFRGRATPGNLVIDFTACKYQILTVERKFVNHLCRYRKARDPYTRLRIRHAIWISVYLNIMRKRTRIRI